MTSVCQMDSLILLHLLHPSDGFDMSSTLSCVLLLQAHVNISKLLLAINVQLSYGRFVFLFLLFLGETVGDFSLFEGLLSPESV